MQVNAVEPGLWKSKEKERLTLSSHPLVIN